MFSARCRSEGLTCLPGGCKTPKGRGRGGGLLIFGCDDDDGLVLLEEALELEASLLEATALVLKNADGCDELGRTAAWRRERVDARRHAEQCWRAISLVF